MKLLSPARRNDDGMTTVTYVMATGFSLIVIAWCTMFIVISYARASIRGASERAIRAGLVEYNLSRDANKAAQACNDVFRDDLAEALPGTLRSSFTTNCTISNGQVSVNTKGNISGLGTVLTPVSVDETTSRPLEELPS